MKGVNKVILIGHLGRDPEMNYSSDGLAIATFSLATTEKRKQGDEWVDATEWHRIKFFGKTAETVGQYLVKGSPVYIEGRIHYDSYEKDGITRYTTDIIGYQMQMLGRKDDAEAKSEGDAERSVKKQSQEPPEDIDDDLPF